MFIPISRGRVSAPQHQQLRQLCTRPLASTTAAKLQQTLVHLGSPDSQDCGWLGYRQQNGTPFIENACGSNDRCAGLSSGYARRAAVLPWRQLSCALVFAALTAAAHTSTKDTPTLTFHMVCRRSCSRSSARAAADLLRRAQGRPLAQAHHACRGVRPQRQAQGTAAADSTHHSLCAN